MVVAAGSVYGDRTLVYVICSAQVPIKYGFPTNLEAADRSVLGHASVFGANGYVAGLVLGANAPKPAVARKFTVTKGYQSSFVNAGNIRSAANAGWKIGRAKIRRGGKAERAYGVYVTIEGIKYAWYMRKDLFENPTMKTDMGKLGIQQVSGDKDYVWGARYPTPPSAKFTAVGTQGRKTLTTMIDPSKSNSLPSGWRMVGEKV